MVVYNFPQFILVLFLKIGRYTERFYLNPPPPGGHFWELSGGGYLARIQIFKKTVPIIFEAENFFIDNFWWRWVFFLPWLELPFFGGFQTHLKFDGNLKSPPPENDTKSSLFSSRFSLKIPNFRFYNSLWSSIKIT